MNFRIRLLGAASALALSGGMLAAAVPAGAVVTPTGGCVGAVSLTKIAQKLDATKGLTDTTAEVKAAGAATTDSVTKAKNGGVCTNTKVDLLAGKYPAQPPAFLTPKAVASVLTGASSCAQGATAQAADVNYSQAYTLTGKITYTMTQTYVEPVTNITKPYKLQAQISILGFDSVAGPDVIDITGMVLIGVSAGSNVNGSLWEDPALKSVKPDLGTSNSGYTALDALTAIGALGGCTDGTAGNVQLPGAAAGSGITAVLVGDGPSPTFGSAATGLAFQQGQP